MHQSPFDWFRNSKGLQLFYLLRLCEVKVFLLILISHREVDQKQLVSKMYIWRIALMLMAIPATAFFSATAIHVWNNGMNSETLITFLT